MLTNSLSMLCWIIYVEYFLGGVSLTSVDNNPQAQTKVLIAYSLYS